MSKPPTPIPFNSPVIVGPELEYIRRTVENLHTSGDGPFSGQCARLLEDGLGATKVMLTPSCTAALELCAILLDIKPGDEVIVPSFTFSSTVNAFVLRGARPVFVDIREDTQNADESAIEALITPRTRAIVVMHYAGVGCEMDTIGEIAKRHGLPVVEDNAHGLFAEYRGRALGTFGCLASQSFHETKNFSCGEGGALVINDAAFVERAEIVRDKGTDRQRLFRGQVDKYTWVDVGSSFVLSDILAAVLYAQLEARERVLRRRREVWEAYDQGFRGHVEAGGIRLPTVPAHCTQGYHMYYLLLPALEARQALIDHLKQRGIHSVFHYTPLHLSRMGRSFDAHRRALPVTERTSETLLRLPFFYDLSPDDVHRIVDAVRDFS